VAGIDAVFVKLCREKFQFLADEFGFRRIASATLSGPDYVLYTNSTTGVGIDYDRRDGSITIVLMRLVDGKPPAYGDASNRQPVWTVLRLRAPAAAAVRGRRGVRTEAEVEAALTPDAAAVRAYAADILRGDFSVFPELERVRAGDWQGGSAGGGGGTSAP
jgi:hypothetical protein